MRDVNLLSIRDDERKLTLACLIASGYVFDVPASLPVPPIAVFAGNRGVKECGLLMLKDGAFELFASEYLDRVLSHEEQQSLNPADTLYRELRNAQDYLSDMRWRETLREISVSHHRFYWTVQILMLQSQLFRRRVRIENIRLCDGGNRIELRCKAEDGGVSITDYTVSFCASVHYAKERILRQLNFPFTVTRYIPHG